MITVGENIIGTNKIWNNYGAIHYFFFSKIAIAIFKVINFGNIILFSIAPCEVIVLNLLCFIYCISSLLLFLISLSKVIALSTIMIAIVVARLSLVFANAFKNYKRATTIAVTKVGSVNVITICEAIQKRNH